MTATQGAHAGIFADDTAGNAQPTAADNGATTIIADGGTSLAPSVTISSAVNVTGDAAQNAVIRISGLNYTVSNSGSLVGTNHMGISSNSIFSLMNSGTIDGNGAGSEGINAPFAIITNTGTISGADDAIYFFTNGGSVTNSGLISGVTGPASAGIDGLDDVTVTNLAGGSIQGLQSGIDVDDRLSLTNAAGATVTGATDTGVAAGDTATIENYGFIEAAAADAGIDIADSGAIRNLTTFSSVFPFNPIAGGYIRGVSAGIIAADMLTFTNQDLGLVEATAGTGIIADDEVTINNLLGATIIGTDDGIDLLDDADIFNGGTITGVAGDGITAENGASIENRFGALISGGDDGIDVANAADILNLGTITGDTGDGIDAGADATITNIGSIRGTHGISLDGPGTISNTGTIQGNSLSAILVTSGVLGSPGVVVTNSGTITSPTFAFLGDDGDDVVNLNQGSRIIGDLNGFGGVDKLNFTGGLAANSLSSPSGPASNSVLGNIYGFSEINKTSLGVAFVGVPGSLGYSIESDLINIQGGGLYINGNVEGNVNTSAVINANGSALGGVGVWTAAANINSGGLSAGAIPISNASNPLISIGKLTFQGKVDHAPGTFIRMDIRPDAEISNGINSDLIIQTGAGNTFDVGGAGLRLSATDNDTFIRNGDYTVIQSGEALIGLPTFAGIGVQFNANVNNNEIAAGQTFFGSEISATGGSNKNTVLTNFFTTPVVTNGGKTLGISIEHQFSDLPGLTGNQAALGAALDFAAASDVPDPFLPVTPTEDFISALDYSSLEIVQETLASLDPSAVLGMASTVMSSNYRLHRLAQDHLAGTRTGTTMQTAPATMDAKGAMVAPATTTSSASRGSVWGTASFDWKDSSGGSTADLDGEDASFTAGVDYRVAPNVLLGILLDGSRGDYDYDGGSSDTSSYRVAVYGTYGNATGIYADFLLGYGDHRLDVKRDMNGVSGLADSGSDSSTDATSFQGLATIGYAMEAGQVKHGPFAGLEYQRLNVDGFTQKGAFPIKVDGFDSDSLRALIGYRVEAKLGRLKPYGSVAYAHEFRDGSTRTSASLPSGAGFEVEGGTQESAFLISLGTGITLMDHLDLTVGYYGEIAIGDGLDSHGASLGMNYSF